MATRFDSLADLPASIQKQIIKKEIEKQKKALGVDNTPKSKYGAKKTTIGNITFDSQKEANRYNELLILLDQGKIRNLKLQREFTLVEAFTDTNGEKHKAMRYRCDFFYEERKELAQQQYIWVKVVEDVKGFKTKEYELKKKLMADNGYYIQEV